MEIDNASLYSDLSCKVGCENLEHSRSFDNHTKRLMNDSAMIPDYDEWEEEKRIHIGWYCECNISLCGMGVGKNYYKIVDELWPTICKIYEDNKVNVTSATGLLMDPMAHGFIMVMTVIFSFWFSHNMQ